MTFGQLGVFGAFLTYNIFQLPMGLWGHNSCKLRSTCRFLTICLSLDPNKVTTLQLLTIFKSLLICRLQFTSLVFLEMYLVRTLVYYFIEFPHSGLGGAAP